MIEAVKFFGEAILLTGTVLFLVFPFVYGYQQSKARKESRG